ncbi:hypothetical protein EI94DRAFT_1714976 [Lactarius quietus]|nr:hypothetical protein EI94DRAFT_1714976 [Lactarius quietus]
MIRLDPHPAFATTSGISITISSVQCNVILALRPQAALENPSFEELREMIFSVPVLNLSTLCRKLFPVKRVPETTLRRANVEVDNVTKYAYASAEPITHAVDVALRKRLLLRSGILHPGWRYTLHVSIVDSVKLPNRAWPGDSFFFTTGITASKIGAAFCVCRSPRSAISCRQPQDNCLDKGPNKTRLFSATLKKPN